MTENAVASLLIGTTGLQVWSDGKEYDPSTECYHPKYSYLIKTSDWEYVGNDIRGGANSATNVEEGLKSLLVFLHACQEGFLKQYANESDGNAGLFPPHVREWAYNDSDEIEMAIVEREVANSLVSTPLSEGGSTLEEVGGFHYCPTCASACGVADYEDGRCKDCHIMDTAAEAADNDE